MRITDREKLAAALQMVPYVAGGKTWSGLDCFGVNEMWYRNVHSIEIDDRLGIEPGPEGLSVGAEAALDRGWVDVDIPRDDDTVILRHLVIRKDDSGEITRQIVDQGHCGVFVRGRLLHSSASTGCRMDQFDSPRVAGRVTRILRRQELL